MIKAKKCFQTIFKIAVSGLLAIVILSVVNVGYNYLGTREPSKTGATDYVWESGSLKSTMREGLAWIKLDSEGYNNMTSLDQIRGGY